MQLNIANKTIFVVGSSSGLGRHFALESAKYGGEGVRLVLGARRLDRLEELRRECADRFGVKRCLTVEIDVTNKRSVVAAFDKIAQHDLTADVIINNAGISKPSSFLTVSEEDFNSQIDTNLKGMFFVSQEGARRMTSKGIRNGSIINVASILGERVGSSLSAYAISKAGVVQMTKASALELIKSGIRVNCILPGYIKTEMNEAFFDSEDGKTFIEKRIPSKRLGRPEELTGVVMLLASDASSFMTGSAIAVDGGHLVSSL